MPETESLHSSELLVETSLNPSAYYPDYRLTFCLCSSSVIKCSNFLPCLVRENLTHNEVKRVFKKFKHGFALQNEHGSGKKYIVLKPSYVSPPDFKGLHEIHFRTVCTKDNLPRGCILLGKQFMFNRWVQ
jgi:hypothetical protein